MATGAYELWLKTGQSNKKWTQKYIEAYEEISRLASSPDRFFVLSKDETRKWKQAVDKLTEAVSELNRLLDDSGEEENDTQVDSRDIGF